MCYLVSTYEFSATWKTNLVAALKNASLIKPDMVLNRIESLPIKVEAMPRVLATYKKLFEF